MTLETATAAIAEADRRRTDAQAAAEAATTNLSQVVLSELLGVEGDDRQRLICHVYWQVEAVPTRVLQVVAGNSRALRNLIGEGPPVGTCADCGEDIRPKSRTERQEVRKSDALRCRPCQERQRRPYFPVPAGYGGWDPGQATPEEARPWECDEPPPADDDWSDSSLW